LTGEDETMQVDGSTPLWIAARGLLYERGDDLFRNMEMALKTSDVEDIHDLRVASRRLREGLALFAPCYPAADINRLVRKTRQITRLLGDIRNADEALAFWQVLADKVDEDGYSELEQLIESFRKDRRKLLRKLHAGLNKLSPSSLRDQYLRTINSPSLFTLQPNGIDLFAPLAGFAKGSIDARLAEVMKGLPEARKCGEVEAQHLLRIAVKHFRYRMEILSPLIGTRYGALHAAVKGYQEVLGKMHDLDVFAAIIQGQEMSTHTEDVVLKIIESQRETLFMDFTGMLEAVPLETVGRAVRDAI
jgi:CHAD domain-containing protein